MKIILLLMLFVSVDINAQDVISKQKSLNKIGIKQARKELFRSLTCDGWMSNLEARTLILGAKFIPVLSVVINSRAIEYSFGKKIADYLEFNDDFPFEFAILLNRRKFAGTIDCFNRVNYADCKPCNYDDEVEEKKDHYNYEIREAYKIIVKRKPSLVFTVKYFRSSIWFIENGRAVLYNMDDHKIYDPDVYIRTNCSEDHIKNMAMNKSIKFCN